MASLREAMGVQNKYNDRKNQRPELTEKVPTPCNKTWIKTALRRKNSDLCSFVIPSCVKYKHPFVDWILFSGKFNSSLGPELEMSP